MNYELYKVINATYIERSTDNITNKFERLEQIENIKNLEWEDNINNVFMSFSFTSPALLECGDKIELYHVKDDVSVWYGVITSVNQTRLNEYEYSGYDAGFYLYKNELTTQYKNNDFEYILKDVCKKCELQIGSYPELDVKYTHLYRKVTAEKILEDVYNNAVKNGINDIYYYDCKNGKVNLRQFDTSDDLRGSISLLGTVDSFKFIKNFNIKNSMEELKNYVEIYTDESVNKKNTDKPDASGKKEEFISKYGLLRYSEDLDKDSKKTPEEVLKTRLDELLNLNNSIEMTVWGNYRLQRGIIATIEEEKLKFSKNYKVLSSKHKIYAIDEEVTIKIEKYEG